MASLADNERTNQPISPTHKTHRKQDTTMHPDIIAFAEQHDVDPTTVDYMVGHIMRELGDSIGQAGSADEQVELVQAGVESSGRAVRKMAVKAMTRSGEFGKVVYDIAEERV